MGTFEQLLVERSGPILTIRMNNPQQLNALSLQMRKDFQQLIPEVEADPDIRAVILTGEGNSFCAGGDVTSMGTEKNSLAVKNRVAAIHRWLRVLLDLNKPLITAIKGWAVGAGFSLALAGDVAIAADTAKFRSAFLRIGAVPDMAMLYLLPRYVGLARAKELILSNRVLTAQEAQVLGIIHSVVPENQLEQACMEYAERLAAMPTRSIALMKNLINRTFETNLVDMLEFETYAQATAMFTDDFQEGIQAFLEKREPKFSGN